MPDLVKKELASGIKWTFLIIVAAVTYYQVAPKFSPIGEDSLRMNTITGEVFDKAAGYYSILATDWKKGIVPENKPFWYVHHQPKVKAEGEGYDTTDNK